MGVTITHTATEGTILDGTSRGDGTAEVVKQLRWRWSRNLAAWYVPRSRDTSPRLGLIEATAAALRAAGHDVEVTIDDTARSTAVVEADKIDRADARADRLRQQAERRAAEAAAAEERADRAATRLPPMGEPVKLDHHSGPRHLRALDRAHRAMGASVAATEAAAAAERRAGVAAATTGARYSPSTVANRIDRLSADQRRVQRELDGYTRTVNGDAEIHAPATGARRAHLQQQHDELTDQIGYWTEIREQQIAEGRATAYSAATVHTGDLVVIRGTVRRVVRANKTTVTVRTNYSWNDRAPWHEVRGLVTEISIPDPDAPGGMPIYEGLAPESALVDGTYTAVLSTDRRGPFVVAITIAGSRLTEVVGRGR